MSTQPINPELASIHRAVETRIYHWTIAHLVLLFAACNFTVLASVVRLLPSWSPVVPFVAMLAWGIYRIDLIMRLQRRPTDPAPKAGRTYRN